MKLGIFWTIVSTCALRHEEEISNHIGSILVGHGNDLLKPKKSPITNCDMICPRKVIFESCKEEEIRKSIKTSYDYLEIAEEVKNCILNMTNIETTTELRTTNEIETTNNIGTTTEFETTTESRTSTTTHSDTLEEHTAMKPTEGSGVNTGEEDLLFESERENNPEEEYSEFIRHY